MGTHQAHHLEGLTDDSCWSIFKERAFAAGGAPMTRDLVDIGTEIARKCHGVPLAAMVMGSLMSSKREIQEWLAIRNSGVWSLEGEESGVLRVLKLSFDHLLSSSVKKCFSYCSIFPKDYDVEKNQIIQLWMAVGFLQSNHKGKVMEDIGEEFFSILVQNSLLQDIRKDKYNNITNCRMHDLVHDLALSVSGSEIFNSNATLGNDFAKARHLALYSGEEIMCEISKERARCLQTLFSSINVAKNILVSFKCLRVLNFYAADIEELPNSVSKLVYLRYLDLSYTPIMVLPEGISKLYNLQTLRLNNCRSLKLKDELRNLVSLRHLYLPAYDHADVIMPFGIGRLTCLRTLKFYNVGEEKGRRIEELGSLKHLRGKLEIHNLQKVSSVKEAQSANLFEKADVQKLKFRWSWDRESFGNDEEVLKVLRPHHNLKSLTIEGFMGEKFPIWVMNMRVSVNVLDGLTMLDNLVKIKFLDCNRCDDIPMLGQLPLLRELEITRMNTVKCISASFYSDHINFNTNGSSTSPTVLFPELMTFRLTNMPNLEEWAEAATVLATTAVFPRLAALTIHDYPKLTNAPIHFPALEKLSIKYCPKMATGPSHFPCMKELEIEEMGNGSPLENISSLTTLTTLRIERMTMITSLPDGLLHNNKNLTELKIWECPKLRHVVNNIQSSYYNSLRFLVIHNCENLRELPDVIPTLMSLEDFSIDNCPSLVSIPSMQSLASLRHMSLVCCGGLTCLPVTLLDSCTSLRSLVISDCHNLVSLPALQSCISLSYLVISDCNKLSSLPEGLYHLTHLETLKIGGFSPELDSFPSLDGIHHLQLSLRKVYLIGWPHWHSIPEQLQHLTGLKCLTLSGFGMEALPEWLGVFSSLGKLFLRGCENLKYFPTLESMQRLIKLETVQLFACDSLPGPDYSKISTFNPTILYKDYPHILRANDIPEL